MQGTEIDLLIEDPRWAAALGDSEAEIASAVRAAFAEIGFDDPAELSVLLADDRRIAGLNEEFRNIQKPTNILSFPMEGMALPGSEVRVLGDLALAFDTIEAEAKLAGKEFSHHVKHLIVHGCLHLLGFTHDDEGEAEAMESTERAALATIGIADPYRET